ncbi:MAG: efflux RND transporter permease subunit [Candidatus Marinimicrobia bacterium]|nr:efflux RND transporter permease subunit [Candidatus Neomarinimicrobiota bacterium]
MRISKLSIKRGVTFTMIYLILLGFGFYGLGSLKLDLYPDITFPVVGVMTDYPGVGPEDIENSVSRNLEKAVVSVENIKHITSWSKSGSSTILLEFDWGTDMDQAEIDVRNSVDFVRDYLPAEASEPLIFAFNPSMQPIIFLTLMSDEMGMAELRKLADDKITAALERINGVASAYVSGGMERQIKVLLDPDKLASHGISSLAIAQTLGMENLQIPGGLVDDEYREFAVRTYGEYKNIDQIRNTVVGQVKGQSVYLKNVASVIDGYKEQTEILRNNDQNAIMLVIMKQSDANTVQTVANVFDELPKIVKEAGTGITIENLWNQADFIKKSVSNLTSTGIQAFLLAFLVMLFFLRHIISSLIASISIPVSIIITFFVMQQTGVTLNIISMAGLALAIGMLIDNSIVVLENIFRHNEMNKDIVKAADDGTTEVGVAIVASTLTTLAIFVPILFVPGIAGVMFRDMVIAIVCSLSVSLFVALTLIPLLSSRLLKNKNNKTSGSKYMQNQGAIGKFLANLERGYVHLLDRVLRHKMVLLISIVVLIIATILVSGRIGGEFMPKTDEGFIEIAVERETAASLTTTNETFLQMEQIIREEVPEATNIESNFGITEGFAAMFGSGSNKGSIMVTLTDIKDRDRSMYEVQDILRERFKEIPGVKVNFTSGSSPMGADGDISVKLFGHDLQMARQLGDQIAENMEKIDGIVDIQKSYNQPKPEYQIRLDRDRISALGLSVYQVASTVEIAVKGKVATLFRENGEEYDVVVRYDQKFRQGRNDLENIFVTSMTGQQIPLKNVASIEVGDSESQIDREDQERMVSISCSVSGSDLRTVTTAVENMLEAMELPEDFYYQIGGAAEDMMESFMWLGIAIIAAIFLVYMVMASQFESLLDPFIIIFTVPLAIMGAIWGLFLTGTTLSVTALIGMVLLVGIVVNNGIVLVDYINQLREKHGYEIWMAILAGGKRRIRPILMTALTTILAMVPIALELGSGAELWVPMARAVIGGMLLATVLTLFVIPAIYIFFERIGIKRNLKKEGQDVRHLDLRPQDLDLNAIE